MHNIKTIYTDYTHDSNFEASSFMIVTDAGGKIVYQNGTNQDLKMPMASTVKVAIALALAKQITQGTLSLDNIYTLYDKDIIPGLPTNFLDKLFFNPEETRISVSLQDMLNNMIKTSDNTSADYILKLIGGPETVNKLIKDELGIKNFNFKSSIRDLLSNYYQFPCIKTPENIQTAKQVLRTAFDPRETEKTLFKEETDSCSAQAMVDLLSRIMFPNNKNHPDWLLDAAPIVLNSLMLCETNIDKLKKGILLSNVAKDMEFCAGKTGSMGAISNDVGIVKITMEGSDMYILMAVFSCLSQDPPIKRSERIAQTVAELVNQCPDFEYTSKLKPN